MKYVLVTGGVVSGLGKGVTASSIGVILKACGLRVTSIKIGILLPLLPFLVNLNECFFFFVSLLFVFLSEQLLSSFTFYGFATFFFSPFYGIPIFFNFSTFFFLSTGADPYLNTDAGTMSPFEHGEVFVLDDGGEVIFFYFDTMLIP